MKKIVAIVTLLIYLTLSVVQVVSIHLCHGELESIALLEENGECCEGMHACHTSCCEDIVIDVEFESDHIYSEEISVISLDQVVELSYSIHDLFPVEEQNKLVLIPPPPEPRAQTKLYNLHNSFLFYG